MSDPLPQPVGTVAHDLGCGRCGHAHRFGPCDLPCECEPHPLEDDVEP